MRSTIFIGILIFLPFIGYSQLEFIDKAQNLYVDGKYSEAKIEYAKYADTSALCAHYVLLMDFHLENYKSILETIDGLNWPDGLTGNQRFFFEPNVQKAKCHIALGNKDQAFEFALIAVKKEYFWLLPASSRSEMLRICGSHFWSEQDLDTARYFYGEVLSLNPYNSEIACYYARLIWITGDTLTALDTTNYYLNIFPNHIELILLKGDILMRSKRYLESYDCYEKAIQLGYKPKGVRRKSYKLLKKWKKVN